MTTQAERDRLVALKKAKKKLITQKQAPDELGITESHVRRERRRRSISRTQPNPLRAATGMYHPFTAERCGIAPLERLP